MLMYSSALARLSATGSVGLNQQTILSLTWLGSAIGRVPSGHSEFVYKAELFLLRQRAAEDQARLSTPTQICFAVGPAPGFSNRH